MKKETIQLSGMGVITPDALNGKMKCFEFLPDCAGIEIVKPCQVSGKAQLLPDGTLFFTAGKPRQRSNAMLIRKVAHGRLSGTRDKAWQLTLKAFATEGIDWQQAFVSETVAIMADLMGPERMRKLLNELMNQIEK